MPIDTGAADFLAVSNDTLAGEVEGPLDLTAILIFVFLFSIFTLVVGHLPQPQLLLPSHFSSRFSTSERRAARRGRPRSEHGLLVAF